MKLFLQLSWYFREQWKRYFSVFILLIIIAFLQILPPKIVGIIIDGLGDGSLGTKKLVFWVLIILVNALFIYAFRYLWRILLFSASYQLAVILRDKLYLHLSQQNPSFFMQYRTGDLMARATNDVDRVVFASGEGVLTLIDSIVSGLLILIIMCTQISWVLTICSLIPMPIMAFFIKRYGDELNKHFYHAQEAFSSLNSKVQENLSSIRLIKAFGLEESQMLTVEEQIKKTSQKNIGVAKIDARYNPTIYIFISLSVLIAVVLGGWLVVQHVLSLGVLTSFLMYLGLMIWPMLALAWMFNIVERGSAAYSRINHILMVPPTLTSGKQFLPKGVGELVVNIHDFHFPTHEQPLLQDINLCIAAGGVLGICGPTGAGKSLLFALILRQFDSNSGQITYHGRALTQVDLNEWRSRVAFVAQTPFLFSDTIANNIRLGVPEATQEEVEAVAKIACIHDDIMGFHKGYNTEIGEKGVMLSGGQKQRIALARALLMPADIFLLDDTLSAIDVKTESMIIANLKHWLANKSLIISAHRLSCLSYADEIVVLKQGRVVQSGQHHELVAQSGWYQDMYRYQQIESKLDEDNL